MRPYRNSLSKIIWALSLATFGLSACTVSGPSSTTAQASRNDPPGSFTYVHLYATPDGATHFKDESVTLTATPFAPPAQPIATGGAKAASRVLFLGFQPRWGENDLASKTLHSTPTRQFITILQATLTSMQAMVRCGGSGAATSS